MLSSVEHLARIVTGLSDGVLEADEQAAIVEVCRPVVEDLDGFLETNDEEFGWVLDLGYDLGDPEERTNLTGKLLTTLLVGEMYDLMASGDKVDEIHEKVVPLFQDSTLPDFPSDVSKIEREPQYQSHPKMGGEEYLRWLERQMEIHHPKYKMLVLEDGFGEDLILCPVLRDDFDNVLASCQALGIRTS